MRVLPECLKKTCGALCRNPVRLTLAAAGVILLAFLAQQLVPGGQWLSFLLLLALLALLALPPLANEENRRLSVRPLALGALQGLGSLSYLCNTPLPPLGIALAAFGVFCLFTVLFTGLGARFDTPVPLNTGDAPAPRRAALLMAGLTFFAFALAWSTVFPADISAPDTVNQLMQARGEIPYSNVHTLAHTLLLALFYRIDPSLALLMLFYALCAAALLGLFAGYLVKRGARFPLLVTAFTPFLMPKLCCALYTQPLKDLPYSLCVGLVTYFILRFTDEGRLSRGKSALLGASLAFCMLFRLNGAVVTLICGLCFAAAFIKRRQWASLLCAGLTAAFCLGGMSLVSARVLHAESPENGFSVQVFGAGIAAVAAEEGNIPPEAAARMADMLPVDFMTERYTPWNGRALYWAQDETAAGDPRTAVFNNRFVLALGAHRLEVVRLYVALFLRNPLLCLRELAFGTYSVWGWQIESIQFYYTNGFLCCLLYAALRARKTCGAQTRARLFALLPVCCNILSIAVSTVTNEMRYLMPTFLLAPVLLVFLLLPEESAS